MSRKLHRPIVEQKTLVVPISQGGTFADDTVEAADNLGLLTSVAINANNGIAGLDANGDILVSQIPNSLTFDGLKVDGPSLVYRGSTNIWTITDYDQYTAYTVNATNGFVSRVKDKIYYTAPSSVGTYGFAINSKTVSVVVDDQYVSKPAVVSPLPEAINVGSSVTFKSSDFAFTGGYQETLITASDAAAGDTFGYQTTLSHDGNILAVGAISATVGGVSNCGAVYVFRKTGATWVQEAKLSASDKEAGSDFGYRIAISADNLRIVITDIQANPGSLNDAGAAYIFTWSGSAWNQEAILTASDKAIGDLLGTSVAISDDGVRVVVGAHFNDAGGLANAGAAYVFTRTGVTWAQEAKLTASNKAANDSFGGYLSMSGDSNRVAISAPYRTISGVTEAGAVYIFSRSGTTWTQEQIIQADDYQINNHYGYRLHLSDDHAFLAVAAQATVFGVDHCGQVYLYERIGTVWSAVKKLQAPDPEANAYFGNAVIISDDKSRLIISAPYKNEGGIGGAGKLYVYSKNNDSWVFEQSITASNKLVGDNLGVFVSLSDNLGTLAAPVWVRDLNASTPDTGAVYVYNPAFHLSTDWQLSTDADFSTVTVAESIADTNNLKSWSISNLSLNTDYYVRCRYNGTAYGTSEWSDTTHFKTRSAWLPADEVKILTASDKESSTFYGTSIALTSDGSRLIVGSLYATAGGIVQAGQAYVYRKDNTAWIEEAILSASDKAANDYFGTSVSITDDGSRVLVTAASADPGGLSAAGAAYIFSRSGTTWTQEAKITASDKVSNDNFGVSGSISADGTRLIIGAYTANPGALGDAGQAYIFSRSGVTWTQEQILSASDKAANNIFGRVVDIDSTGTRVVVGSQQADPGGIVNAGAAYVFSRSGTVWTQEQILTASDKVTLDTFGNGVLISDDGGLIAIGASLRDSGGVSDSGAVYIYTRVNSTWTQETILTAPDKAIQDYFGFSIDITADKNRLLVGCYNKDLPDAANAGAAYLFEKINGVWTQLSFYSASDRRANDSFGIAVSMAKDGNCIAIGAIYADTFGYVDSGAVYLYA